MKYIEEEYDWVKEQQREQLLAYEFFRSARNEAQGKHYPVEGNYEGQEIYEVERDNVNSTKNENNN